MSQAYLNYAKLRGLVDALRDRCNMGIGRHNINQVHGLIEEIVLNAKKIAEEDPK